MVILCQITPSSQTNQFKHLSLKSTEVFMLRWGRGQSRKNPLIMLLLIYPPPLSKWYVNLLTTKEIFMFTWKENWHSNLRLFLNLLLDEILVIFLYSNGHIFHLDFYEIYFLFTLKKISYNIRENSDFKFWNHQKKLW